MTWCMYTIHVLLFFFFFFLLSLLSLLRGYFPPQVLLTGFRRNWVLITSVQWTGFWSFGVLSIVFFLGFSIIWFFLLSFLFFFSGVLKRFQGMFLSNYNFNEVQRSSKVMSPLHYPKRAMISLDFIYRRPILYRSRRWKMNGNNSDSLQCSDIVIYYYLQGLPTSGQHQLIIDLLTQRICNKFLFSPKSPQLSDFCSFRLTSDFCFITLLRRGS